jgi:hypothetical protein
VVEDVLPKVVEEDVVEVQKDDVEVAANQYWRRRGNGLNQILGTTLIS